MIVTGVALAAVLTIKLVVTGVSWIVGGGLTVSFKLNLTVCNVGGPSCIVIVYVVKVVTIVGVPLITPDAYVNPAGNVGLILKSKLPPFGTYPPVAVTGIKDTNWPCVNTFSVTV